MVSKEVFVHYILGLAEIDSQHWSMFELMGDCVDNGISIDEQSIRLQKCIDYWTTHTTYEVDYMKSVGYPFVEAHVKDHDKIAIKLLAMKEMGELHPTSPHLKFRLSELSRKILNHIDFADRQLSDFVAST